MLPLRSSSFTEPSLLLRVAPPLCSASVLWRLWDLHLRFSLYIVATGSHVPHKSLYRVLVAFMPDAAWAVNRFPPDFSRSNDSPSVLTSFLRFRHLNSDSLSFDCNGTHLTESGPAFSQLAHHNSSLLLQQWVV